MIFFTSDLHLNHANILKYTQRPWTDGETMNQGIVDIWNETVSSQDTIYILGDIHFGSADKLDPILRQLNGIKYLVRGNHDLEKVYLKPQIQSQFGWIRDYHEMTIEGQFIVMSHYPFKVWNKNHYGSWNLHGHSHGGLEPEGKQLDVGIDNSYNLSLQNPELNIKPFAPLSFDVVKAILDTKEMVFHDHHRQKE